MLRTTQKSTRTKLCENAEELKGGRRGIKKWKDQGKARQKKAEC